MKKQKGLSPIAIILLAVLVIGGYLVYSGKISLNQKSTTSSSQKEDKVAATSPTTNTLPVDWTYQASTDCSVESPIPPKKEPYYESNGLFWDFPRGVIYPNLLSKFPNGYEQHKQANTWYTTEEAASGQVLSAVSVSCIPNANNIDNQEMMIIFKAGLQKYNEKDNTVRMEASRYTIQSQQEVIRWSQKVIDLTMSEYYQNPGGQPYPNTVKYTLFTTPKFIYEVRILGTTENSFVKDTAKKIFDNLKFQ